jgi:hypothetical protein
VSKPAASNWANLFGQPEKAPKEGVQAEDLATAAAPAPAPAVAPAPAPSTTTRTSARYNVTRPVKKADTYRLPLDAHALIRAEIADAAENGNRLTKDDVVTKALRALYGKKHDSATIDHFIAEIESGMKK